MFEPLLVAGTTGLIVQLLSGVLPAILNRLPTALSWAFRIARIAIPLAVLLASIGWALWVGVHDSNKTGQAAAHDLVAAQQRSEAASALTEQAVEKATYATAQSTQGLVIATVGVIGATVLAAIGFAPERVSQASEQNVEQHVRIHAEQVVIQADDRSRVDVPDTSDVGGKLPKPIADASSGR